VKNKFSGEYTPDWPQIAQEAKEAVGWCCIRCKHPHDRESGHILTTHHLDGDKSHNAWWNVLALCQKCHLRIQGRVILARSWMLPHSEWFKPYVAGYYAHINGMPEDKASVLAHLDELLALGQGVSQ